MGLIGNLQDKLSGHKDPAVNASYNNQGANTYQTQNTTTGGLPGHDSSHPTHGTTTTSNNPLSSNAPHGNSGITGGSHPLVSGGNNTNTYNEPGYQQSGPGLTGTSHSGGLNDNSYAHNNTQGGIVPGSHPAANNPSAIPTAGGQRVGSVDDGYGHSSSHAGVHETAGDKLKNALPGQQGNAHDAYGNPINPSTTGAHTMSSHSSHPTGSQNTAYNNQPGYSSNQPLSHDSQFNDRHAGTGAGVVGGAGLASSGHHDTHNTHNTHNVGEDNRGMMDKAKDALSSKRSNQPDDPITGTNYDQKTRDQYTGDQYNTHNTHNTTTGYGTQHHTTGTHGGLASHQQHGSGVNSSYNTHNTAVAGEDNRGMMDKAKNALSSKRSNQPDDPITGTNYDQKDRREYTEGHQGTHNQTAGVTAGGLASHQQYGSNTHDNYNTHGTHSSHNTRDTHNTHNTGVVHEDNRGMMDKAKDALSSKRSNQPDDPITGTNYDQKDRREYTEGTHGTGYTGSSHDNRSHNTHQQAGVAGITSGLGQTHLGSNTHSSGPRNDASHIGRSAEWKDGYEAGYQEALRSLNSGSHTGAHSGSNVGSTGAYSSNTGAGYADHNKPTMGEKMNPKTDADRDGKVGFMD